MIAVADYSGPDATSFTYQYYEDLTTEDTVSLLEDLKAGRKPQKVLLDLWHDPRPFVTFIGTAKFLCQLACMST